MSVGPFTIFNAAINKPFDGTFDFDSHTFKAVLCNATQALDETFVGGSGNCRYADLTGELSTANGYTNGGVALSGVTLTKLLNTGKLDCDNILWTLTGSITFKYLVIFDDSATNDDLFILLDFDLGGSDVTANVSPLLIVIPPGGLVSWVAS